VTIVSIGEILWDVFPDSERLGGAPFNFSVHATRLGCRVSFVSAVGDDERGRKARARAVELGLGDDFIQTAPGETGMVSVKVDKAGQPDFTIHRPAAYDEVRLDETKLARLSDLRPDWLYFGTLHQAHAASRAETGKLIEALPDARRFYDVNLRRDSYTPELVRDLLSQADVVKLNEDEASAIDSMLGEHHASLEDFTLDGVRRLGWYAAAVTRGEKGCAVRIGEAYAEVPGYAVQVADTVGAGDAFAAALLYGLGQGWSAARIGDFANRVGAVVASRPGGVPPWTLADCEQIR
jgi:fructokinase